MSRLQSLARRVWDGSSLQARRLVDAVTAWIRQGRRDDLSGVAAILGCILRALLVLVGIWLLWRLIRAMPALLWLIVPVWCWKAVRAAPAGEPAHDAPADPPVQNPRDAVLTLLHETLGDRDAVHLSEVLQRLQANGQGEGWKVSDLRARLEALDIPVALKVKAGGKGPTRGVVKAELPPLSHREVPEASTAPSTAA
ncbi:hypothetical protein [Streptomyces sp. NPDC058603]|uniref:hypothetical protein n=1 Tax=Streptomyces sp. NPDC058603 TaxID=3346551 RepID=UPI00364CF7A0